MKKMLMTCAALAFSCTAYAAPDAAPAGKTVQQTKMVTCNADATGKKGDERKAFMKQCLSSGKADKVAGGAAPADAANDKAKLCKGEAKGMRGNARKDFLAECMTRAA